MSVELKVFLIGLIICIVSFYSTYISAKGGRETVFLLSCVVFCFSFLYTFMHGVIWGMRFLSDNSLSWVALVGIVAFIPSIICFSLVYASEESFVQEERR